MYFEFGPIFLSRRNVSTPLGQLIGNCVTIAELAGFAQGYLYRSAASDMLGKCRVSMFSLP